MGEVCGLGGNVVLGPFRWGVVGMASCQPGWMSWGDQGAAVGLRNACVAGIQLGQRAPSPNSRSAMRHSES